MSNRLIERQLSAPVNVTWEVTYECNLSCSHCLSASGRRSPLELTTDEGFQLIDQLSSLKVFQINFGGGEPFLRGDFVDLVQYARRKGIVTCISTNGTLLDKDLIKYLKQDEAGPLFLQVSLDGASAEVNDRIRGSGVFEQVCRSISLLAEEGIKFSLNSVLTRVNYGELNELYRFAKFNGAQLRLSRFRPTGRGKVNWSQLHLNKEQLLELSMWLNAFNEVLTGDSFFSITTEDRQRLGLNMCGAAKFTCSISPEGKVYPCAFLQDEEFTAGDIRREPVSHIWRNSTIFELFRQMKVDSCKTCSRFEQCHGGCPAVAYYLTNSLNEPDPECLINCLERISQRSICRDRGSLTKEENGTDI